MGTPQSDALQGHRHGYMSATGNISSGYYGGGFSLGWLNNGAVSIVMDPISDGVNGIPRTANETRPINLALLPCIRALP